MFAVISTPRRSYRFLSFFLALSWSLSIIGQVDSTADQTLPDSTALYAAIEDDPLLHQLDSMLMNLGPAMVTEIPDSVLLFDSTYTYPDKEEIARRLALLDLETPFDLRYNSNVQRFIELYTKSRKEQMSRMLGDAEYFFPLFEAKLEEYDIPIELKYLAIVESALNPSAVSRARARGLWQFMLPTGRLYGLNVNSYVDERHDPIMATDAACRYLKDLHEMFGDWSLALAAYNSGPGNVRKAIRRSGGKRDYWEIKRYLPRETRSYVPAFIAVNYAFSYSKEHKIYPKPTAFAYHQVDTIMIDESVHFDQLTAILDMNIEHLRKLNPQFIRDYAPANDDPDGMRALVLPFDKAGLFISFRDSVKQMIALEAERKEALGIEDEPEIEHIVHRVRSGESLGLIAQRYGVRVSEIKEWNNINGSLIHSGQRLTIYSGTDKGAPKPKPKPVVIHSDENTDVYMVQPGDTLYDIAKKYPGVSADLIMEWNNISSARSLKPGMKIKILKKG